MTRFLISGSRGTDDPTLATLPFMTAKTAKEQGHDVVLWLWSEAVTLSRKGTADHVVGVTLTPLKNLVAAVQAANTPLWVCGACAVTRQVTEKRIWLRGPRSKACRTISRLWRNVKRWFRFRIVLVWPRS
jgi:uncharacterized protein involved in oxidation of intracellular sulfur